MLRQEGGRLRDRPVSRVAVQVHPGGQARPVRPARWRLRLQVQDLLARLRDGGGAEEARATERSGEAGARGMLDAIVQRVIGITLEAGDHRQNPLVQGFKVLVACPHLRLPRIVPAFADAARVLTIVEPVFLQVYHSRFRTANDRRGRRRVAAQRPARRSLNHARVCGARQVPDARGGRSLPRNVLVFSSRTSRRRLQHGRSSRRRRRLRGGACFRI